MSRTKWMRLVVGDLADLLRWAGQQHARHISDFRYRLINGQESVSFRLILDYRIEIGTSEIIVVCHVREPGWRPAAQRLLRDAARHLVRLQRRWTTAYPQPRPAAVEAGGGSARVLPLARSRSPSPASR